MKTHHLRHRRVGILKAGLILVLATALQPAALAFKPKTHVWVGQQVLNDVLDDGFVTIRLCVNRVNGKSQPWSPGAPCQDFKYPVAPHIVNALRRFPDAYRAGQIGPDAYPDFVAGQMTAHPGVEGAWLTNDWVNWLQKQGASSEEVTAFFYGYLGHVAGDVFAHSYVNSYSGDLFLLTDGEATVEKRHIAIESFIDGHTPPLTDSKGAPLGDARLLLKAPRTFLADHLILNDPVAFQYLKGQSPHLAGMHAARKAVRQLTLPAAGAIGELEKLIDKLETEALALHQQIDAQIGPIAQATLQVRLAREFLEKTYEIPIRAQEALIAQKTKAIQSAIAAAAAASAKVNVLPGQIASLQNQAADLANRISNLPDQIEERIQKRACEEISKWGVLGAVLKETVCRIVDEVRKVANPAKAELRQRLTNVHNDIANRQAEFARAVADEATQLALRTAAETARAEAELERKRLEAERSANVKAIEALRSAEHTLKQAQQLKANLETQALAVKKKIDAASGANGRYSILVEALKKWPYDMRRAVEAYEDAATESARQMTITGGQILDPFFEWQKCWMPVFMAVPKEVLEAGCGAVATIRHVRNQINAARAEIHEKYLGETGGWVVDPMFKIEQEIDKKVVPELQKFVTDLVFRLTGPDTKTVVELLTRPMTASELDSIMGSDASGKHLLLLGDASQRILKDMSVGPKKSFFDPERFAPAYNAVVLAKLSLLDAASLNKLVRDAGVTGRFDYGPELFATGSNVMTGAFRSIDGDHQWAVTAPRLPRQAPHRDKRSVKQRTHGLSFPAGFRLWQSEPARQIVFHGIFKGPLSPGLLDVWTGSCAPTEKKPFPTCSK